MRAAANFPPIHDSIRSNITLPHEITRITDTSPQESIYSRAMRPTVIAIPASKEAHVQQHYLPPATITLDLNEIFSNEEQVNDFFEKARIGDEASSILHQVEQIICAEGLRQVR